MSYTPPDAHSVILNFDTPLTPVDSHDLILNFGEMVQRNTLQASVKQVFELLYQALIRRLRLILVS